MHSLYPPKWVQQIMILTHLVPRLPNKNACYYKYKFINGKRLMSAKHTKNKKQTIKLKICVILALTLAVKSKKKKNIFISVCLCSVKVFNWCAWCAVQQSYFSKQHNNLRIFFFFVDDQMFKFHCKFLFLINVWLHETSMICDFELQVKKVFSKQQQLQRRCCGAK